MGQLYIANVSWQRQVVMYTLSTDRNGEYSPRMLAQGTRQEVIERGQQVPVSGDLHPGQMAEIIDQLEPYGMIGAMDIPNNLRGIHTLVYNFVPTPTKLLDAVHAHNTAVRTGNGAARREAAAIAANEAMKMLVPDTPKVFDLEIEQEAQSELGEKSITDGFHVINDINEIPEQVRAAREARARGRLNA